MMLLRDPETDPATRGWLEDQARLARPWPFVAALAGALQGVAIIAQAALLAWLIASLVMEDPSSPDALRAGWLALPLVFALRALASGLREEAGARAAARIRHQVRMALIDQIHRLGPAWRSRQTVGGLSSLLLEQVDALEGYYARYRPQRLIAVLIPSLIVISVFPLNWAAGLILLLTAPLIPLFMVLVGLGVQARQAQQLTMLTRMSGHFLDLVRGLPTLRLLDAHRAQAPRVAAVAEEFRQRTMSVLRIAFLNSAVLEFFAALAVALSAVYFGFSLLGELDFGYWRTPPDLALAFFVLILAPEFYLPLRELGTHYHARAEALAAAQALRPILTATPPQTAGAACQPPATPPALALRGVSFSHDGGVTVLEALDLTLAPGEHLAIVGESGAGKTTLLRLILGELVPTAGEIRVDGRPLADYDLQAWREHIGWMSQHPRLLAASLADNLRIARHDADDRRLRAALEFAGLGDWYARLPEGLETMLGEGGRLLSGGQLRRLALARVYLRDAPLLLLDEPTASLDQESEHWVIAGLERLAAGRSLILLSHRRGPLALADRVLQLVAGRLVPVTPVPGRDAALREPT